MNVYLPVSTDARKPIAKFYYKGSHSHPVRRTVLVFSSDKTKFTGFEVREGSVVRMLKDSPIKTYTRSKIANFSDLGPCKHRQPGPRKSTLRRYKAIDVLLNGV